MKVFLCIGQSNMAGPSVTKWESKDDKRLQGVYLLNDKDEWEKAKNPINRYSTVKIDYPPGLSPAVSFIEKVKEYLGEEVGIVSNSRGSSKISEWQKGERCYEEIVRRALIAKKGNNLAGIIWLQGEQDAIDIADYQDYDESFLKFILDIRKDLGDEKLPFICGEIWGDLDLCKAEWKKGVRAVNRRIKRVAQSTENCVMVSTKGAMHTDFDPVHFAPEGMRKIGRRYATSFIKNFLERK